MTPSSSMYRFASVLVGIALCLSGCNVVETQHVSLAPYPFEPTGLRCDSALGAYALPKAFIHVRVEQSGSAPPELHPWGAENALVKVELHPDQTQVYCLDHLNSPTSSDNIRILKYSGEKDHYQKDYLQWVLVNTSDQSALIAQALIRTAFIIASGNRGFRPRASEGAQAPRTLLDLEYDPFDAVASAQANRALTDKGFCLVLENFTTGSNLAHEKYCSDPERYAAKPTAFGRVYKDYLRQPADPKLPGIVYRPRQSYRLSIYQKVDPKGPEPWRLRQIAPIDLENISPILRLDLTRVAFAGKRAHFKFDRGALVASCISKASEVEGFVSIPLEVSKSLVELPASIIQVQINQVNQNKGLVEAQERVLLAQRRIIQAMISGGEYKKIENIPGVGTNSPEPFDAGEVDLNDGDQVAGLGFTGPKDTPEFGSKAQDCELEKR